MKEKEIIKTANEAADKINLFDPIQRAAFLTGFYAGAMAGLDWGQEIVQEIVRETMPSPEDYKEVDKINPEDDLPGAM